MAREKAKTTSAPPTPLPNEAMIVIRAVMAPTMNVETGCLRGGFGPGPVPGSGADGADPRRVSKFDNFPH